MNKLTELLSKIRENLVNFWSTLDRIKKILLLGGFVAVIAAIGISLSLVETPTYQYLYTDLPQEEINQIVNVLRQNNTTNFIVDQKGIQVPTQDLLSLRLKLAQEGLPNHGVVGWEKFDSQDFSRTEFEQRINKQRAIQGELSRTISLIEGITHAKVHIVAPKKSVFIEENAVTTAAVYLKTKPGFALDKKQVKGIVNLVSKSVEGLHPTNVTIIDGEGKMLTEPESDDPNVKMTKEMLSYKRAIEKQYEENVRGIVGRVVGFDRIDVKVDATVDFTQEQQTISDVDPDRVATISRETQGYSLNGTGLNPTGIPGSKSNVPGEQESINVSQSSTSNKKDSEVVNFEVAKKVSQKTLPVGKITKLSTAVIVDGKQQYPPDGSQPTFEPRTEDEIKKLEELVRSAIGFEEKRGDIVTVRNMMFQLDQIKIETIKEETRQTREYISTLAISAAIAVALIFFFTFIVRPYFRWLSYDPSRKHDQQVVEDFKPDMELGTMQNVQIKEDIPFEKLSPPEQVLYLAKNEPKRTTEAIRLLLNPHQNVG
jgi:flagellar M-ring protein FliF